MIYRSFIKCIFVLLIICCSCNYLSSNQSSHILPIDSVAVIIADSYFVESEIYVAQNILNQEGYSEAMYSRLFEKHGITKEIFTQNIRYYITDKKQSEILMKRVDEIVEQRVAALRDSLDVEMHAIARRDSLEMVINMEQ